MHKEKASQYIVEPKLVNPHADAGALRLMTYLCSIYGSRVLTGQQIGVESAPELEILYEVTGKYPAVYGFDFMNYSPSRTERGRNAVTPILPSAGGGAAGSSPSAGTGTRPRI